MVYYMLFSISGIPVVYYSASIDPSIPVWYEYIVSFERTGAML